MRPIRGGPLSRGPFQGPLLHNDGSTGEITRAPLYVTAPWKGWAAPDLFPNIAALIITAVYVPPAMLDPQVAHARAPQIDQYVNVAALAPAPSYQPAPLVEPTFYRRGAPPVDLYPNVAVNLQTQVPAGTYIDPPRYPRLSAFVDVYPNVAVNLQSIRTWPLVEVATTRRPALLADLYPNLAALVPVVSYIPPPPIEPQVIRKSAAVIEQPYNLAGLTSVEPPKAIPAPIEPTVWRARLNLDLHPNPALLVAQVVYVPPAPVEPTFTRKAPAAPDVYRNLAVNLQTIITRPGPEPAIWRTPPAKPDLYPNIAPFASPPGRVASPTPEIPPHRTPWPQPDIYPNLAVRFVVPPYHPTASLETFSARHAPLQIDVYRNLSVYSPSTPIGPVMPNLYGLNFYMAIETLQNAGIYLPLPAYAFAPSQITVIWAKTTLPGGYVSAQSLAAGLSVTPGTPVTLTVSEFVFGSLIDMPPDWKQTS
jgi:PASTA domain